MAAAVRGLVVHDDVGIRVDTPSQDGQSVEVRFGAGGRDAHVDLVARQAPAERHVRCPIGGIFCQLHSGHARVRGVRPLCLNTQVVHLRAFACNHFGDGVDETRSVRLMPVRLDDRDACVRFRDDEHAGVSNARSVLAVRGGQMHDVERMLRVGALGHMDDDGVLGKRGVPMHQARASQGCQAVQPLFQQAEVLFLLDGLKPRRRQSACLFDDASVDDEYLGARRGVDQRSPQGAVLPAPWRARPPSGALRRRYAGGRYRARLRRGLMACRVPERCASPGSGGPPAKPARLPASRSRAGRPRSARCREWHAPGSLGARRHLVLEPCVALLFQFKGQGLVAAAYDASIGQDMHVVRDDVVEQALVVRNDQEAPVRSSK